MSYKQPLFHCTRLGCVFAISMTCTTIPAWSAVTGDGLGTVVSAGDNFVITGGTRQGGNLFHSFSAFNIADPESATFDNGAAAAITNVIGRINGASSTIDGNVSFTGSSLSNANLYLINPAGIVIGNNASINIPGSFHASTANNISLNGTLFDSSTTIANLGNVLYAANPTAFGFLSGNTSAVSVVAGADINVGTDKSLSLIGSGLSVDGVLDASSGRINLASVDATAAAASVSNLDSGTLAITGTRGTITTSNARLNVSGLSTAASGDANGAGGDVYIIGGDLTLTDTSITSELFSDVDSGNIVLNGTGTVSLTDTDINTGHDQGLFIPSITIPGFTIFGVTFPDIVIPEVNIPAVVKGTGNAGDLFITGNTVNIGGGSNIFSRTEVLGGETSKDSGSVTIVSTNTMNMDDFGTFTTTPTSADIVINDATIFSEAVGGGRSGDVTIGNSSVHSIYLNDANISTIIGNSMFDAGTVSLLSDFALVDSSMIFSNTTGTGGAGLVGWTGNSVTVQDLSEISSSSSAIDTGSGAGDPGIVRLLATEEAGYGAGSQRITVDNSILRTTTVDGDFGGVDPLLSYVWLRTFGNGEIRNGSTIAATSTGAGSSSFIYIQNGNWVIDGTATTVSSSQLSTTGTGDAGFILLGDSRTDPTGRKLDSLVVRNGATVSTNTIGAAASDAGVIDIKVVNNFDIETGARLTSSTNDGMGGNVGLGDAGVITVYETGTFSVTGANSNISTNTTDGAGGDINITVNGGGTGDINTGGVIESNTNGDGDAGTISLNGGDWTLSDSGLRVQSSQTTVDGLGDAGDISITADNIYFETGADISSTTSSTAALIAGDTSDAGSITLTATGLIDLDGLGVTRITSESAAFGAVGDAGSITFNAATLNLDLADVFAQNRGGGSGLIDINVSGTATIDGVTFVAAGTLGAGDAGGVDVDAMDFVLDDRSYIRSTSSGTGAAGSISVTATNSATISNGSDIKSNATGAGDAGFVKIIADTFFLDNSQVETNNVDGAGGNVIITATTQGNITNFNAGDMVNGITVATTEQTLVSSSSSGSSDAGVVDLEAGIWNISGDAVDDTDGSEGTQSTVIRSTTSSSLVNAGNAGNVFVTADTAISLDTFANISSNALAGSKGDAGNVLITTEDAMEVGDVATDTITIGGGAIVQSSSVVTMGTQPTGDAGSISFDTDIFTISGTDTRISTNNNAGSQADVSDGTISIASSASTVVSAGAQISSNTQGTGNAGSITIDSGSSILITGNGSSVTSNAIAGSSGDAGNVTLTTEGSTGGTDVNTDTITISANAKVQSNSVLGSGNAGSINIDTDVFDINGTNSEISTNNKSGTDVGASFDNGEITVNANVTGQVRTGGQITSNTSGDGDAGAVSVTGGQWTLTGFNNAGTDEVQIESSQTTDGNYAAGGRTGDAGQIDVTVNRLTLQQGGRISTSTTSDATLSGNVSDAGNVTITADDGVMGTDDLIISSGITFNFFGFTFTFPTAISGISANSNNGIGNAGQIIINAARALLSDTLIQTRTNAGVGGDISITSNENFDANSGTAITSDTIGTGNAGRISLNGGAGSSWALTGASVNTSADTTASGGAGDIDFMVDTLLLDGDTQIVSDSTATEAGIGGTVGTAGQISIAANSFTMDGATVATNTVDGNVDSVDTSAGVISVDVGSGVIRNTGAAVTSITSSTSGMGDAGFVAINADTWSIKGDAVANADGSEGLGSTVIRSTTTSAGNAGQVAVTADTSIVIDEFAQITSDAGNGSTGNAGQVDISTEDDTGDVVTDSIMVLGGSEVSSSSTRGTATGAAGGISIQTDNFTLDGANISTQTRSGTDLTNTTPQLGSITVTAVNGIVKNTSSAQKTEIKANTLGSGQAGDVILNGGDWTITGNAVADVGANDVDRSTRITSGTVGSGSAGLIQIIANSLLSITDYALVATSSAMNTSGNAGQVSLQAGTNITIDNNAKISSVTASNATGNAGQIEIITENDTGDVAGDSVLIQGGATVTSSSLLGLGAAGDVQINTDNFTFDGGTISSQTNAGLLNGGSGATQQGSISVNANTLGTIRNTSTAIPTNITADTIGSGPAGDISLTGLNWNITGNAVDTAMSRSTIISSNTSAGSGQAGFISIMADAALSIAQFARIATNTLNTATGGAGNINLTANNSITIASNADVASNSETAGAAGSVTITTDPGDAITTDFVSISGGGEVSSGSSIDGVMVGTGDAGNVAINTDTLTMNASEITTETENGAGGNITITSKMANIANVSDISADSDGSGDAGTVSFTSTTSLNVNSGSTISSSSNDGTGSAGSVNLTTPDLDVDNATVATVNGNGATPATITIDATTGVASASFSNNARVTANTFGTGPAGDIMITAGDVLVETGSIISSSSQMGTGSAGNISIQAGDITVNNGQINTVNNAGTTLANIDLFATNPSTGTLTNGAQVTADTVGTGGAGNITLRGPRWIINGSSTSVSSSTSGAGDAGQIDITPTTSFLLDGAAVQTNSTSAGQSGAINVSSNVINLTNGGSIQSNVSGTGNGGVVTLTSVTDIFLTGGANVSTNTTTANPSMPGAVLEGNAGDIFINAAGSLSMISSLLTSSTTSDGEAGTVTISTGDSVYLLNSTILVDSSGATTAGVGGGDLNVTTGVLVLDSSTLDASAGSGTGGNVSINAGFFFISPDSVIDVSSASGASGTVSVNAVAVDLSGSLNALKIKFKDGGKLLRQACATKGASSNSSSFIVENGIDGIPSSPTDFQSASPLDILISPLGATSGSGQNTSSNGGASVTPTGTALFAAIACGGF